MPGCRRLTLDEDVVLWVQNSQPFEIPAGEITLNVMGHDTRSAAARAARLHLRRAA